MIGAAVATHLRLIGSLSPEDEEAVLRLRGEIRDVGPGEVVLREGERPQACIVVLAGLLQRHSRTPDGRQIHSFYMPTDTPSFESIPMEVMDNTLAAVPASRIGVVSHAEIARLMEDRPRMGTLLWRETLVQGAIFRAWLTRNSQLPAEARLAHLFCELITRARASGTAQGQSCTLPVTREDIADAIGMPSVQVNRSLQLLASQNLATLHTGILEVPDLGSLSEIAAFDPSYLHLHR